MSTMFSSVEQAKGFVASMAGVDPGKTIFEEVPDLHVLGMGALLLGKSETSEEVKKSIQKRIDSQKGFMFKNSDGQEIRIVIGPFREGFDCWVVAENGAAMRI